MTIHLTNDLQAELKKIGSRVKLKTEADANFGVKFNFRSCAWGELEGRGFQVLTSVEPPKMHLQLEEKGIAAGGVTIHDIPEMAIMIYKWLDKRCDIFDLSKEYAGIGIPDRYKNLRTLSDQQFLSLRWEELSVQITKGTIEFREDVFEAFRANFAGLFPFFSLENLAFSDVFYSYPTFPTPFVFCDKDVIEIGYDRHNTKDRKCLRTISIPEAIEATRDLLPAKVEAINPLKA